MDKHKLRNARSNSESIWQFYGASLLEIFLVYFCEVVHPPPHFTQRKVPLSSHTALSSSTSGTELLSSLDWQVK